VAYSEAGFTQLRARLLEITARTDLATNSTDALFINQARQFLQRKNIFRAQSTSTDIVSPVITANYVGNIRINLPTRFRAIENLTQTSPVYFGGFAKMNMADANAFYSRPVAQADDVLEAYVIDALTLVLFPAITGKSSQTAASYFQFKLFYDELLAELTVDNPTDYFCTVAFDLILQTALIYFFIWDKEFDVAQGLFTIVELMAKEFVASEYGEQIQGKVFDLGELQTSIQKFGA